MGRPKKAGVENIQEEKQLEKFYEYRNVTPNETMYFEVFSDEDEKHIVKVEGKINSANGEGNTILFSEKDLKKIVNNDTRILDGRLVPVGGDADINSTTALTDIMTEERLKAFIKNTKEVEDLKKKIEPLKSINTISRVLNEAKKEEYQKTYAFVNVIEQKLNILIKEKEAIEYNVKEKQEQEEKENKEKE